MMVDNETTEEFRRAFCHSGSLCVVTCEFCKRTHFVTGSNQGDYQEGELEELRALQQQDLDNYVSHPDTIRCGMIDGNRAVLDCPCQKFTRHEEFIWEHRHEIAAYLNIRSEKELRAAHVDAEMTKVNEVSP